MVYLPYKNPEDHKRNMAKYYQVNKEERKKQIYARRRAIWVWFVELRMKTRCVIPGCKRNSIQFHHVDTSRRHIPVTRMAFSGYSKRMILKEIEFTAPLCIKHHAEAHKNDPKTMNFIENGRWARVGYKKRR